MATDASYSAGGGIGVGRTAGDSNNFDGKTKGLLTKAMEFIGININGYAGADFKEKKYSNASNDINYAIEEKLNNARDEAIKNGNNVGEAVANEADNIYSKFKNAGSNYGIVNSSFEKIDNLTKQKVDELANNITKIGDSESTPSSNTNTVGGVQPDIKPVWNGRGTAPYNK